MAGTSTREFPPPGPRATITPSATWQNLLNVVHARAIFHFNNDIDVTSAVFIRGTSADPPYPGGWKQRKPPRSPSIPDAKQQVFLSPAG